MINNKHKYKGDNNMDQKSIKNEMSKVKSVIEEMHGDLRAFKKFPKGVSNISYKGRICPDHETFILYKKYSSLCALSYS